MVNPESSTTTQCLIHALVDFELMISLCQDICCCILKWVTIALQGVDIDIVTGYSMIKTVTLQNASDLNW